MTHVAINEVIVNANRRPLNDQKVAQLMQSIQTNGLLNPITIDQNRTLIAGLHRLTACRLLGFVQIECKVVSCDSDQARLAEIDENLIRNELDALERAELWLERDQILDRLGLRAKSGDNQYTQRQTKGGKTQAPADAKTGGETNSPPLKTTLELAQETGYTERTFQQGKQIAREIDPEVKAAIRGTPIAKSPSALLKLARAGNQPSAASPPPSSPPKRSKKAAPSSASPKSTPQSIPQSPPKSTDERPSPESTATVTTATITPEPDSPKRSKKELQLLALQSLQAEQAARQKLRQASQTTTKRNSALLEPPVVAPGEEWLLDRHWLTCDATDSDRFIEKLPADAALAIATLHPRGDLSPGSTARAAGSGTGSWQPDYFWQHDYLKDLAHVTVVIAAPGAIHQFCRQHQMPWRYEWLWDGWYVAVCSHHAVPQPEQPFGIEGLEGIVTYFVSLYTKPGHFVLSPFAGHGEVLMTCERLGRICFAGDPEPSAIAQSLDRWQKWTGRAAQRLED